jgi:hypothetical protein
MMLWTYSQHSSLHAFTQVELIFTQVLTSSKICCTCHSITIFEGALIQNSQQTLNRTATPTNRLVGVHLNRGLIGGQTLTMPANLHVKFHFLILYFTFLSCNVWSVQP